MNFKKYFFLVASILIFSHSYSQNKFEKGYYINNQGATIDGYIKNYDWLNNPQEFEFKKEQDSTTIIVSIKKAKLFQIINDYKYQRFNVLIDKSKNNLRDLSVKKQPELLSEVLFLKLLFDGGKTDLYEYHWDGVNRYFFTKNDTNIQPLIYKKYLNKDGKIAQNNQFKQQLYTEFICDNISLKDIENIKYERKALVDFFSKYDECQGYGHNSYNNIQENKNKGKFNLYFRPRINLSSLSLTKENSALTNEVNVNFNTNYSFGLGLDFEYILPFNNKKWSIFIEPNYQNFNDETLVEYNSGYLTTNFIINYSTIAVPSGIRHYLFLNNSSKLFANLGFSFYMDLNTEIYDENKRYTNEIRIKSSPNLLFGLGYNYNNQFNLELRTSIGKSIVNYGLWKSDYSMVSLIAGYNFL